MDSEAQLDADKRQELFLSLFLPQQSAVRAFIRSIVWDRSRCEDLFQEVALVLWREFDRYDPARPFGPWARGVAAKVALKGRRDVARGSLALSPAAVDALEGAFQQLSAEEAGFAGPERQIALSDCLSKLPDKTRRLVQLRYVAALSAADIANTVRSTPEAVQKALTRARATLQSCVERRLRSA